VAGPCLEHLLAIEGVELVAVVLATGANRPVRAPGLVRLYENRLRGRRIAVTLADAAAGVPRVGDTDLDSVRALDLDFVLSLGVDSPAGPILEIPRYGVWAFDFDRDWTGRLGLGELRRVARGEPVAEAALLRLEPADDRAVVLREGWFRVDDRTPAVGVTRTRDECSKWPAWACSALQRGEASRFEGPVVGTTPTRHPVPGSAQMLRLAALVVRNRLRAAWWRLFRHPQWNIGIVDLPIHALLGAGSHPPVRWFPLAGRQAFLADPFGLRRGEEATILCEYFDYRRAKGTICSIDVSGGDFASSPEPALELAEHSSYPCLVEDGDALYCIPEAHRAREVALFKADPFPRGWTKVGTLLHDVSAMDPTVFRYDERWWLMCADGDNGGESDLLVWHAATLEGPWLPHAANPVKIDVRSARPGGTPFEWEGNLYRPAQDCSQAYGGRVVVNRVTRLTPQEFAEVPVTTIEPDADGPYPAGRHTLSALGDLTLIDGHRFVFVGAALGHFLRIWGRNIARAARGGGPRHDERPAAQPTERRDS
jgi:hypothetical protein